MTSIWISITEKSRDENIIVSYCPQRKFREVFFVSEAQRKSQKTRGQQREMAFSPFLCIAKRPSVTVRGANSNRKEVIAVASTQVNPTRMELTRLKKKLVTATRGHKLLKDKRDELMRQFLDLARENMALRLKVEEGIRSANKNFVIAKAGMSEQALNAALIAPKQEVYLETGKKNVMSVDIPVFEYKTRTADENDIYSYGFAFTSGDLDGAVKSLADILPDMLKLSETEKACQLMAAEIEKTRRRVNALEHVIIPETKKNIKYITMKLDENERSTQIRLMKVKDMMLEEAHHYKEKQAAIAE